VVPCRSGSGSLLAVHPLSWTVASANFHDAAHHREASAPEAAGDAAPVAFENGASALALDAAGRGASPVRVQIIRGEGVRARLGAGGIPEGESGLRLLRRDAMGRRALALVDLLAAGLALVAAGALGAELPVSLALLMLPILVLIVQPTGLYHRDEHLLRKTTLDEAPRIFQVATLWALVTWLSTGLWLGSQLQPLQVLTLWLLLFVLMLTGRALARLVVCRLTRPESCLVLGDAETAAALRRKFEVSFSLNATVVGRVPLTVEGRRFARRVGREVPVLGQFETLDETLVLHGIDRVIIAPTDSEESLKAIRVVKSLGVKISVLPRMLEVVGSSFEFDDVDGVTLLGIRRSQITRSSHVLKRGLDLTAACVTLAMLSPLLAVIALMIKVDSKGPALYKQKRIGRNGREFHIYKFRSMCDGADTQKADLLHLNETEGLFKIANDPRVTRVGRILRKTSLDELPQIWNVVRGEMSLVGPRPLVPDDDAKIHGWERMRLNVTPGMTGPWQILGSTRVPLEEMVKIDYLYGATWSLWLDIKILLRTVGYVLARRSA
jgi:exopolysaccharide biosynthesis polyprenyl glycosylphosphotransferase